jgi:DNA polymerase sigma
VINESNARVDAFGSFAGGLSNPGGDLDMCMWRYGPHSGGPSAEAVMLAERAARAEPPATKRGPGGRRDRNDRHNRRGQETPEDALKKRTLYAIVPRLQRAGFVDVTPIVHARIPIIEFRSPGPGIHVDLCIGNELAVLKSRALGALGDIDPRFSTVCRLVKFWHKFECGIFFFFLDFFC